MTSEQRSDRVFACNEHGFGVEVTGGELRAVGAHRVTGCGDCTEAVDQAFDSVQAPRRRPFLATVRSDGVWEVRRRFGSGATMLVAVFYGGSSARYARRHADSLNIEWVASDV